MTSSNSKFKAGSFSSPINQQKKKKTKKKKKKKITSNLHWQQPHIHFSPFPSSKSGKKKQKHRQQRNKSSKAKKTNHQLTPLPKKDYKTKTRHKEKLTNLDKRETNSKRVSLGQGCAS